MGGGHAGTSGDFAEADKNLATLLLDWANVRFNISYLRVIKFKKVSRNPLSQSLLMFLANKSIDYIATLLSSKRICYVMQKKLKTTNTREYDYRFVSPIRSATFIPRGTCSSSDSLTRKTFQRTTNI
ncbi:hypothetical protein AVEN_128206-1 [Araneus ventricosus]|uniref:Uncharacterized protein n=1 Tax=Araneus ventricosus TaxID=182803 RepID=A0A4Y2A215_ARAVE|nr:hypothetical protein AVEN_128206-1 [Araneus ventricosus]